MLNFLFWLFPRGETHLISRALFLRGLGVIYLVAILSWWVQADELIGSRGLIPMQDYMERAGDSLDQRGESRLMTLPTLFWLGSSDSALQLVCLAGTIFAVLLIAGFFPGPCLVGLWAIYLSLLNTGGPFMSFQWDILLVEAGFLSIWLAPWRCVRAPVFRNPLPLGWGEKIALWLSWLVIAKLMFQSGWVKLAWATTDQPEWWPDHTAMTYHYLTQPIPNPLAWWMHQLPVWFQKFTLWPMYFVELVLPAFVFLGPRLRLCAALGFSGLMLGILTTGNYTYFNWLTIVLCIPLVSDRYLVQARSGILRLSAFVRRKPRSSVALSPTSPVEPTTRPRLWWTGLAWRAPALVLLTFLNIHICLDDWHGVSRRVQDPLVPWTHLRADLTPEWADRLRSATYPFHISSGYGLFRTMTIDRPEIVLEGSPDGIEWREYHLHWKPGRLEEPPPFVAPHQPRVAWQFWFAALEPGYHPRSRNAVWLSSLVRGLLNNNPTALSFFEENPFPDQPPQMVRGVLYRYEFTTPEERKESGNWWKREKLGLWLPPIPRN